MLLGERLKNDFGQEGIAEANFAAAKASALGLSGSIIYYDIEAYSGDASCGDAVTAFIGGWVEQLHADNYLAGVYLVVVSPRRSEDE